MDQRQGSTGETAAQSGTRDVGAPSEMNPGDQAPPGTPGTGENLCPTCSGSGRLQGGESCRTCGGTGLVTEGVSGGG
jgi:DnaJ-class molecular chaperone